MWWTSNNEFQFWIFEALKKCIAHCRLITVHLTKRQWMSKSFAHPPLLLITSWQNESLLQILESLLLRTPRSLFTVTNARNMAIFVNNARMCYMCQNPPYIWVQLPQCPTLCLLQHLLQACQLWQGQLPTILETCFWYWCLSTWEHNAIFPSPQPT